MLSAGYERLRVLRIGAAVALAFSAPACGIHPEGGDGEKVPFDPTGYDGLGNSPGMIDALSPGACAVTTASGVTTMTLTVKGNEIGYIFKRPTDNLVVANATQAGGAECTASASTKIVVNKAINTVSPATAASPAKLLIDFYNGWFALGSGTTANLTVNFQPTGDTATADLVMIRGQAGNDDMILGGTGALATTARLINVNVGRAPATLDTAPDVSVTGVDILQISTGPGDDIISGQGGQGTGVAYVGYFEAYGGPGDDKLTGGGPSTTTPAVTSATLLAGGIGNDQFLQTATKNSADNMQGGGGTDTVDYSSRSVALTVVMDGVTSSGEPSEGDRVATDVTNLKGGSAGDVLSGNALNNVIEGGAGDDILQGGTGDDRLYGGTLTTAEPACTGVGRDTADYSDRTVNNTANAVTIDLGAATGTDTLTTTEADVFHCIVNARGGAAADRITGSTGDNFIWGGGGDDIIDGLTGNDTIYGEAGNDTIHGSGGNDFIDGGAGIDTLYGDVGDDFIDGGSGDDKLTLTLVTPAAAPTATPTQTGSDTSTYGYRVVALSIAIDGTVVNTAASPAGDTGGASAAALDVTNYNTITWAAVTGATSYDIYRVSSDGTPATVGKIGNVLATAPRSFVDNGVATLNSVDPTTLTNTTPYVSSSINCGGDPGDLYIVDSGDLSMPGLTLCPTRF